MKKLVFSLICINAFASSFVGVGFYGANVDSDIGIDVKNKDIYTYEVYTNKFYSGDENNLVYDARIGYTRYKSDIKYFNVIKGSIKSKALKMQALGGYGLILDNNVSVSILGGLGYEKVSRKYDANVLDIVKTDGKEKDKSMFLKTGVATKKQFDNNFTVGAGAYLKYFTKKIEDVRRFSPEADVSLGYTFTNNIYSGVKVGYENDLIGHGGKLGFELGYKF